MASHIGSWTDGWTSGIRTPKESVIRDETAWRTLWDQHSGGTSPAPAINFGQNEVVAIFAGEEPSAGYRVQVLSVEEHPDERIVRYRISAPPPNVGAAAVLTQPFAFRVLARRGVPTVLVKNP